MIIDDKVIQLTVHVRRSLEKLAREHGGGYWGSGLTGYCGIASRFLINLAKRNGIYNMRLVCGFFNDRAFHEPSTHCWIEYNDFCIDLTISQFSEFHNKAYRICLIDSDFYRLHYTPEMIGSIAVKYQKQWENGQNYESCANSLWRIHKKHYIKDYNGVFLR